MTREYKMYINGEWVDAPWTTRSMTITTLTQVRCSPEFRLENAPTPGVPLTQQCSFSLVVTYAPG